MHSTVDRHLGLKSKVKKDVTRDHQTRDMVAGSLREPGVVSQGAKKTNN